MSIPQRVTLVMLLALIFLAHLNFSALKKEFRYPDFHVHSEITASQTFGVGFDFTGSYGTVALSFHNGSNIAVAKVEGDAEFREMMARLSLESSTHPSPPYDNFKDEWDDKPRQWWRRFRKSHGWPASQDVGTLSKMMTALLVEAQKHVTEMIRTAVITHPETIALYQEDLIDAFEFSGLEYVQIRQLERLNYETSTAYAGYGHGLCKNYTVVAECHAEFTNMTDTHVTSILYSQNVLTVSLSIIQGSYYLWEPRYRYLVSYDLGYGALDHYWSPKQYWEDVRAFLSQVFVEHPNYPRPEVVIAQGDSYSREEFQAILNSVLGQQCKVLPKVLKIDTLYAAAKGAAEFSKRAPWNINFYIPPNGTANSRLDL